MMDSNVYRVNGTGVQSVPPRYSPQQLFQALFSNFVSTGLTPDQVAQYERDGHGGPVSCQLRG